MNPKHRVHYRQDVGYRFLILNENILRSRSYRSTIRRCRHFIIHRRLSRPRAFQPPSVKTGAVAGCRQAQLVAQSLEGIWRRLDQNNLQSEAAEAIPDN